MIDRIGTQIYTGQILYNTQGYNMSQLHISFGGFSPLYARTLVVNAYGNDLRFAFRKDRAKFKNLIVLSDEQFNTCVESIIHYITENNIGIDNIVGNNQFYIAKIRDYFAKFVELSNKLKAGEDCTELLALIKK